MKPKPPPEPEILLPDGKSWVTDEGLTVNGICPDGLVYKNGDQRTVYGWETLSDKTRDTIHDMLSSNAFST